MVSTSILLCLLGSFFLYSTSTKMKSVNAEFRGISQSQNRLRKLAGLILLLSSYIVLGIYAGFGAAIAYFLLVLTFAASMVVLLYPLKVLTKFSLLIILFVSLAIEFLV